MEPSSNFERSIVVSRDSAQRKYRLDRNLETPEIIHIYAPICRLLNIKHLIFWSSIRESLGCYFRACQRYESRVAHGERAVRELHTISGPRIRDKVGNRTSSSVYSSFCSLPLARVPIPCYHRHSTNLAAQLSPVCRIYTGQHSFSRRHSRSPVGARTYGALGEY